MLLLAFPMNLTLKKKKLAREEVKSQWEYKRIIFQHQEILRREDLRNYRFISINNQTNCIVLLFYHTV